MSDTKLCISCMRQVSAAADHCPLCGYNGTQQNPESSLPIGTRVGGTLVLGMQTDTDGETLTYAGYDVSARERVVVREFCPKNGCIRENGRLDAKVGAEIHYKTGISDFSELYGTLRDMPEQTGLLRVKAVLSENNTSYAVFEDFDGISLAEFMQIRTSPISSEQSLALMSGVFSAVQSIHSAKLLHRGISPENIFISRSGEVRLAGFASAAVRTMGTEYTARLYDGFTAPEQYVPNAFASAAADVYALAACIYFIVSRVAPPDAQKRKLLDDLKPLTELVPEIAPAFSRAVEAALVLDPKHRTSSVKQLLFELQSKPRAEKNKKQRDAESETEAAQAAAAGETTEAEDGAAEGGGFARLKKYIVMAAVSLGLFLIMVGVYFGWEAIKAAEGGEEPVTPVEPAVQTYTVPSLVGLDIFEDELVYTEGLRYQITFVYTDDVAVNTVVSISPAAGTSQEEGTTVTIRVSRGSRIVEIPDLTNYSPENAAQILDDLGVQYSIQLAADKNAIVGVVFWQSVKAGTKYNTSDGEIVLKVAQ